LPVLIEKTEGIMSNLYFELKNAEPFFLIAGPCVIETEAIMFQTAETLVRLTEKFQIPLIYKSSFLKANRTSASSYSGPGREQGLKLLQKLKNEFGIPILTDVHETSDVPAVAEICDIIQIPAFLCRQTALLQAAACSNRIVNIKKGQFLAPEDMKAAAEKVSEQGNNQILLTERGTSFGYHNLVVDFRAFTVLKEMGYPVVYDVTHSLQKPSETSVSGGNPQYAKIMAQAALATGCVDGLFIETHPEPTKALSDAASMLPLEQMDNLLESCIKIKNALE